MDIKKHINALFVEGHKKYLQNISIDCIIFGFHENELKVLLLQSKYTNQWALPGGFIMKKEHMDDSAKRILQERTGLEDIFLNQFHTFSDPKRCDGNQHKLFAKKSSLITTNSWIYERFISVGYSALVDFTLVKPVPDIFSVACEWQNVSEVPELILDHHFILQKALDYLREKLNYQPIGYNLLPKKFTMPQLQALYETILNKKLDRRNFQRKILGTGILKKLNETKKGMAHKAPFLYQFNLKKYNLALKNGMGFEL
jgi:8-oxo-dGTP diphosphatase